MMRVASLALAAALTTAATWIDPHATAREASKLYAAGKFDDATATYREALVEDPDSPLLHYNLGAAAYRAGTFEEAAKAFAEVPADAQDTARAVRAAYDLGNAQYRIGATAESSNPQQALAAWAQALVAYRRALGGDPDATDAKFNYEFVAKRIADLEKKLDDEKKRREEQQKQEDQPRQDQQQPENQQTQPQDQQRQGQQEDRPHDQESQKDATQQNTGQQEQPQSARDQHEPPPPEQQHAGAEHPPQQAEPRPGDGTAGSAAAGEASRQMTPQEAAALLDRQRDQDVRPDEVVRRLEHGDVAEPEEDW